MITGIFADIVAVIGLGLLGYGLFLYDPRISYCTVGVLLIVAGYKIGRNTQVDE